jgi:hypothetical protein
MSRKGLQVFPGWVPHCPVLPCSQPKNYHLEAKQNADAWLAAVMLPEPIGLADALAVQYSDGSHIAGGFREVAAAAQAAKRHNAAKPRKAATRLITKACQQTIRDAILPDRNAAPAPHPQDATKEMASIIQSLLKSGDALAERTISWIAEDKELPVPALPDLKVLQPACLRLACFDSMAVNCCATAACIAAENILQLFRARAG